MSKYDWATIQKYYDEGHTFRELREQFGTANRTLTCAVKRGDLISRNRHDRSHRSTNTDCLTCGKPIPSTRSKYCSDKCCGKGTTLLPGNPRYTHVKNWRKNNKAKLVACFGGECGICGLIDHPVVYDFHHLDGSGKEFTLTQKIRSWVNVVAEAMKCVMLCAPCHRKHHAGVLDIPDDIRRFQETE